MQIKIKVNKNKQFSEKKGVCRKKKVMFFILFICLGVFILDKKNPIYIISRITRKHLGIHESKQEKLLFNMLPNHFGFFRFLENQIDVTSFTSINPTLEKGTNFSLYPFKKACFYPPLVIKNGSSIQGLSGFSKILSLNDDLKFLYDNNSENFNPLHFCNIKKTELPLFSNFIDTNNIIIGNQNLKNLTNSESSYLFELTLIKKPLPNHINQNNWCLFQTKYTKEQQLYRLKMSHDYLRTHFDMELQPLIKIQYSIIKKLSTELTFSDNLNLNSNIFFENISSNAIINRKDSDIFED